MNPVVSRQRARLYELHCFPSANVWCGSGQGQRATLLPVFDPGGEQSGLSFNLPAGWPPSRRFTLPWRQRPITVNSPDSICSGQNSAREYGGRTGNGNFTSAVLCHPEWFAQLRDRMQRTTLLNLAITSAGIRGMHGSPNRRR